MNVGSLFSGIGGLDLGLAPTFGEPAWLCEFEAAPRRILERHFPGVPIFPDVREIDESAGPVDVLHGGYPCQPFSSAGLRRGEDDPRHLWPEFARLVRVLRPRVVVAENVAGHLRLGFDRVLADLAEMGFDARWGVVRASEAGAPHRRERLFVVASDSRGERLDGGGGADEEGQAGAEDGRAGAAGSPSFAPDAGSARVERSDAAGGEERREVRHGAPRSEVPPPDPGSEPRQPGGGRRVEGGADARAGSEERDGDRFFRPAERGETFAASPDAAGRGRGRGKVDEGSGDPEDGEAAVGGEGVRSAGDGDRSTWGVYAGAVERWERISGRLAPRPTDDRGRLSPEFVEWMMGLPDGWTEGENRTARLKMLGNAVVPAQAALAMRMLR